MGDKIMKLFLLRLSILIFSFAALCGSEALQEPAQESNLMNPGGQMPPELFQAVFDALPTLATKNFCSTNKARRELIALDILGGYTATHFINSPVQYELREKINKVLRGGTAQAFIDTIASQSTQAKKIVSDLVYW